MSNVKVNLNDMPDVRCVCGHPYFVSRMIIKRIPGLTIGSTVDQFAPLNFMACALCNEPHIPMGTILAPNIAPSGLVIPKHQTEGQA